MGTVAAGARIETSTGGEHRFTVTAISRDGQRTVATVLYTVDQAPPAPPVRARVRLKITRLRATPLRDGCVTEIGSGEWEITAVSADATCRQLRLSLAGVIEAHGAVAPHRQRLGQGDRQRPPSTRPDRPHRARKRHRQALAQIARPARDQSRPGVTCTVVMTRSSEWYSAFRVVTKAGCRVHLFPDRSTALYIHEKLILDDHGTARESLLIGSQNASVTSLTRNRELGILLSRKHGGSDAIATASATFDSDFRHASRWSPPKPRPKPEPGPTPKPTGRYPKTSSGNCY